MSGLDIPRFREPDLEDDIPEIEDEELLRDIDMEDVDRMRQDEYDDLNYSAYEEAHYS